MQEQENNRTTDEIALPYDCTVQLCEQALQKILNLCFLITAQCSYVYRHGLSFYQGHCYKFKTKSFNVK